MPWVKIDDHFDDDPDVRMLSDQAVAVHICAMTWSSRWLTEGFVPVTALVTLRVTSEETVKELCTKCLPGHSPFWIAVEGGYQIRSYLKFNPTKEQVLKDRAAAKDRQSRHRNARSNAVTDTVTDGVTSPSPVPVPVPNIDTPLTPLGERPVETPPADDKFDPLKVKLPENVKADDWALWVAHRREKKRPLTKLSVKEQLLMLAKDPDPSECIHAAIRGGYQGLFPTKLREQTNGKAGPDTFNPVKLVRP